MSRTDKEKQWMELRDGESEQVALKRRVKMHEFLLTGGVQIGINAGGVMEYTSEIDPVEYGPACPWHGEACSAWTILFREENDNAGRVDAQGYTLAELREKYPNIARTDRRESIEDSREPSEDELPMALRPSTGNPNVDRKIAQASQYAPNSVAFGDGGTFVASTALCARHWNRALASQLAVAAGLGDDALWGKAPKSRYGCVECIEHGDWPENEPEEVGGRTSFGNPWDRGHNPQSGYGKPEGYVSPYASGGSKSSTPQRGTGKGGFSSGFRRKPRLEDSRDTAVRAFDMDDADAVIEIEGDEDE